MKQLKGISLYVTTRCDLFCEYCDIKNVKQKNTTEEILNKHLPYLATFFQQQKDIPCLSGGEPSLLPEPLLKKIFETIDIKWTICTNGGFVKKDYHNKFFKYINNIYYHWTNLEQKIPDTKIYDKKIDYYVVVTHKNIGLFIEFLKNNYKKNVIIPKILYPRNLETYDDNALTQQDLKILKIALHQLEHGNSYHRIKHIDNILYFMEKQRETNINELEKCSRYPNTLGIDLTEERIINCCLGYTNLANKPLNKFNLFNFNIIFNDIEIPKFCKKCPRLDYIDGVKNDN